MRSHAGMPVRTGAFPRLDDCKRAAHAYEMHAASCESGSGGFIPFGHAKNMIHNDAERSCGKHRQCPVKMIDANGVAGPVLRRVGDRLPQKHVGKPIE